MYDKEEHIRSLVTKLKLIYSSSFENILASLFQEKKILFSWEIWKMKLCEDEHYYLIVIHSIDLINYINETNALYDCY